MRKPPCGGSVRSGRGSGWSLGRLDGPLGGAGRRAEVGVLGRQQVGIDAAALLDRADGAGAYPESDGLAEGLAQHRRLLQVWDEPAAGLVVGVADIVASHRGFPGKFTATSHGLAPSFDQLVNCSSASLHPAVHLATSKKPVKF